MLAVSLQNFVSRVREFFGISERPSGGFLGI